MDRIADIWGTRTPYERGGLWPTRVDTKLADGLELLAAIAACEGETSVQLDWLIMRMKQAAPQALLVA